MINKEEIKKSYYYTDIDPTLDSLNEIINICVTFNKEGGDRLMCAMDLRKWDLAEIERLSGYIVECRQKMETELIRLNRFKDDFNDRFATDHNNYYNSVDCVLKHIRSHTSALKIILQKTCPLKHPDQRECQIHGIESKSVMKSSVLATGSYQKPLFDMDDPSTPTQVLGLFQELKKFFTMEAECITICKKVLKEEADIRKDPVKSKYVLDKYRHNAQEKLRGQILLISEETISMLKEITPAYQNFKCFATDEAFAQEEFHKHNVTDMDHFCLIELASTKQKYHFESEEIALWGNNPEKINTIKCVVKHFDELLPDYFTHKLMGRFQYYFCKWAYPSNIRRATEYFIKHYQGKYKVSKYGAVNTHSKEYDINSPEVKKFNSAIQTLLNKENKQKQTVFSA